MPEPKEMKRRDIDEEKSLRQMKGLDGDAIAEDHRIVETHDRREVFEAEASADATSTPNATRAKDDVDIDRAA